MSRPLNFLIFWGGGAPVEGVFSRARGFEKLGLVEEHVPGGITWLRLLYFVAEGMWRGVIVGGTEPMERGGGGVSEFRGGN